MTFARRDMALKVYATILLSMQLCSVAQSPDTLSHDAVWTDIVFGEHRLGAGGRFSVCVRSCCVGCATVRVREPLVRAPLCPHTHHALLDSQSQLSTTAGSHLMSRTALICGFARCRAMELAQHIFGNRCMAQGCARAVSAMMSAHIATRPRHRLYRRYDAHANAEHGLLHLDALGVLAEAGDLQTASKVQMSDAVQCALIELYGQGGDIKGAKHIAERTFRMRWCRAPCRRISTMTPRSCTSHVWPDG